MARSWYSSTVGAAGGFDGVRITPNWWVSSPVVIGPRKLCNPKSSTMLGLSPAMNSALTIDSTSN